MFDSAKGTHRELWGRALSEEAPYRSPAPSPGTRSSRVRAAANAAPPGGPFEFHACPYWRLGACEMRGLVVLERDGAWQATLSAVQSCCHDGPSRNGEIDSWLSLQEPSHGGPKRFRGWGLGTKPSFPLLNAKPTVLQGGGAARALRRGATSRPASPRPLRMPAQTAGGQPCPPCSSRWCLAPRHSPCPPTPLSFIFFCLGGNPKL